jgi:hypothetical protein
VKISPLAYAHKISALLFVILKPLGIWGLGGLAVIDAALIPIPVSMDAVVIGYVVSAHKKFLLYCLMSFFCCSASTGNDMSVCGTASRARSFWRS